MPREQHIKVYRSTGTSLPLPFSENANGPTFGELAYVDGLTSLYIGKNDGSRAWVGAEVTGGDIEQGLEYAVPTMKAVKDYVVFKSLDVGAYFTVQGEDGLTHDVRLNEDNSLTLTGGLGIDVVKSAGEDDNTIIFRGVTATTSAYGVVKINASGALLQDVNGLNISSDTTLWKLRDEKGIIDDIGYGNIVTITGGVGVDFIRTDTDSFVVQGITATTATLGVAAFHPDRFTIASGVVSTKQTSIIGNTGTPIPFDIGIPLYITGSDPVSTTLSSLGLGSGDNNAVLISVSDATNNRKGIASFNSTDFDVTSGSVSLKSNGRDLFQIRDERGSTFAVRIDDVLNITGGRGVDVLRTSAAGNLLLDILAIQGATATNTTLGVASFPATYFDISSGVVSLAAAYQVTGDTVTGPNAAITVTKSGRTATIDARLATDSLTGVASFSNSYFSVTNGLVTLVSAYQVTGDTVNGPSSSLTITRSGRSVTLDNRFATTSLTGVASFDSRYFDTGTTGHVRIVMVDGGTFT